MIRASAIRLELPSKEILIVIGVSHDNCEDCICELKEKWQSAKQIKGYVLHNGKFMDEEEALVYAYDIGQLSAAIYGLKHYNGDTKLRSNEIF